MSETTNIETAVSGKRKPLSNLAVGLLLAVGSYGLLGLSWVVIWLVVGMSNPTAKQAATTQGAVEERGSEVYILALCDMTMKEASISKSSYDSGWEWKFQKLGSKRKVVREFEAANAFGTKISGTYVCQYDVPTDRVTTLWVDGPMGVTRVIG